MKGVNAMTAYKNFDTGEIWTREELEHEYNLYKEEMRFSDFEEYLEEMLGLGRQKTGGFVEYEPFAVINQDKDGDCFDEWFSTKEEALDAALATWQHLTDREKARKSAFYVLESVNPDPEAPNHFDGDVIKDFLNPDLELRNSFDDITYTDVDEAISYFRIDDSADWFGEENAAFNDELDSCTDLYEVAEVLNKYSDTLGNGSRYEVVEI